jgi:hypothetical protein
MAIQLVPTDSNPNQTWQVTVSINGAVSTFTVTLNYNPVGQYWSMSLFDASGNLLLSSMPLVTGTNLLGQFQYLFSGSVWIINASNVTTPNYPNDQDLGTDFQWLWGDNVVGAAGTEV